MNLRFAPCWRILSRLLWVSSFFASFIISGAYAQTGAAISVKTKAGYKKSNQSKVFFYDHKWWAIAFYEPDSRWYIWRYDGAAWIRTRNLDPDRNRYWDAVLNADTGKLYVFGSHLAKPIFRRYTYAGGTWNKDTGFPITLTDFPNVDQGNPVSLAQGKNGDLWIFRIHNHILQAKHSTDGGASWSAVINIKSGLTTAKGTTDAGAFIYNGENYVGVAYGETEAPGNRYGFLRHRDGDPEAAWIDESTALTFYGNEGAQNQISMAIDANNNVYLLTRNAGGANTVRNTLYKRTNTGKWIKFKVNAGSGPTWKSPVVAIDTVNQKIYFAGINTATLAGEYKTCLSGHEQMLNSATVTELFSAPGAAFDNLSMPAGNVNPTSGLMVCADNTIADDIWNNLIPIDSPIPVNLGAIMMSSSEVNANASYTIPLTLAGNGALKAGLGTINIIFPENTHVPDNMNASEVLVDGAPAASLILNPALRKVAIRTPADLPNNHSFNIVFNAGAGLLNPTLMGSNYQLTVLTSAQQAKASSPSYSLVQATTTVTPATVTLSSAEPNGCANYTITFNLGAHGRMLSGLSVFTLTFDPATSLANGALNDVMVNGVHAEATGDNAAKTVQVTLPVSVALGNHAAVTIHLPSSAICNPATPGNYALSVATSVESMPVASNPYHLSERLSIGTVLVAPSQVNAPASYTIPLTLSSTGALTAGVDAISFIFPAGTVVTNSMPASQITVDGTPATTIVANSATREVMVTTPVTLSNGHHFLVVFNTGAGLLNPATMGDYSLQVWTSMQTTPATSPLYALGAENGSPISTATKAEYRKSNQSKIFYHDNQWWAIALYEPENRWYIWKYDGSSWSRTRNLEKGAAYHWDAVMNAGMGKLYLFGSHRMAPEFRRYSYASGAWNRDVGFPVMLSDFPNQDQGNPVSLVQAKNGDLWLFRIEDSMLQAKRSGDGGASWSAIINIKTGLNTASGTTDGVAFGAEGANYVGVAYGEPDAPSSQFGFLLHRDGDPDEAWTDESSALTFFGSERSRNNLSMTSDGNNVYLFTQNSAVTGDNPRNTLYKRHSDGSWQKFKVNSGANGATRNWKSPAIAIDAGNGMIYTMGVNTNTQVVEYKICLIGQEAGLENATVTELFSGASFEHLSVPAANVEAAMGLMIGAANVTTDNIWYRHLAITGTTSVQVGAITVASNEVNANATYTIPLTLFANGALGAGTDIINFLFPGNTFVPNSMPAGAVLVDGTPAVSVASNSATRQVSVVVPVNLPNNHTFSVVFNLGAKLLNPTTVDSAYQLTVWTSAQPTPVSSPSYSLVQATTTVTAATVVPYPSDADSLADYTLDFYLGDHGRLLPGASAFVVRFGSATRVKQGILSGAKVNSVTASATGDSALRQITVMMPASVSLTNHAAVTLFLSRNSGVIRNPALAGDYTLTVATSVETTAVVSKPYAIEPNSSIGAPIVGTTKYFDRNNQSKMFYHGGYWWVTAQAQADLKWYLWKFDGATWTKGLLIYNSTKVRPDCILEVSNNKAYIVLPGADPTYLTRLSYASGNWLIDAGYPYPVEDFAQSGDRGINLARANNGDLWVFMMADSTLLAKHSSDEGQTWSATIIVKDSLHNLTGLTDAVPFAYNGENYIGVGYAENSANGSVYGFLRHRDGDPDSVWIDETAAIPQFSGTTSDDHISMAVHDHTVFMIVKTNGGGPATANVGLLRRETDGVWHQDPILLSSGWTRPALAIDANNNMLYAIGTREGPVKVGEMKKVAIGNYASLMTAPIDTIFKNHGDGFFDVSVAAHHVNGTTNLLICNGNETRNEMWYNLITLGGAPKQRAEESIAAMNQGDEHFEGVKVYPNPFNPQTTIRFKVKAASPVKLQIFNITGQLVRTLVDRQLNPGIHDQRWNGRNQNGHQVASGVYFYRLQIGPQVTTGRLQMIK